MNSLIIIQIQGQYIPQQIKAPKALKWPFLSEIHQKKKKQQQKNPT